MMLYNTLIHIEPMPTPKETYNYCEELIEEEINSWIIASHLYTQGQALATFKQELKDLYKHLENIQNMKTSYLSGR
jgi:hypothetical protein